MSTKDKRSVPAATVENSDSECEPLVQPGKTASSAGSALYDRDEENAELLTSESPSVVSNDVINRKTGAGRSTEGSVQTGKHSSTPDFARSVTSDCIKAKGTSEADDDAAGDESKCVRRLSSGDTPYWLVQVRERDLILEDEDQTTQKVEKGADFSYTQNMRKLSRKRI